MPDTPNQPQRSGLPATILFSLIGAAMIAIAILELTNVYVLREGICLPLLIIGAINLVVAPVFSRKPRQ